MHWGDLKTYCSEAADHAEQILPIKNMLSLIILRFLGREFVIISPDFMKRSLNPNMHTYQSLNETMQKKIIN